MEQDNRFIRMLHVMGLAHRAQATRPEDPLTEAQQPLPDCLRHTIEQARPAFIAEERAMKKGRLSEEQIVGVLKEAEAGVPVKDLCPMGSRTLSA
jgi:hypothetical protein